MSIYSGHLSHAYRLDKYVNDKFIVNNILIVFIRCLFFIYWFSHFHF